MAAMGEPASITDASGELTIFWRDGATRVCSSAEQARDFASEPLSDTEVDRGLRALQLAEDLRRDFTQQNAGQELSEADIEEALQSAREH